MAQVNDYTFPKSKRLLTPKDFQRAFDNIGCKQGGKFCTLLAAKNELEHSRLGLIVSKRNIKNAVDRNTFKRQTRETFRLYSEEFHVLTERFDIIALAKAPAEAASPLALRHELERQWSKLISKLKQRC